MYSQEKGGWVSEDDEEDVIQPRRNCGEEEWAKEEEGSEEEYAPVEVPRSMVVRRSLSIQGKEDDSPIAQRENLFHTRGEAEKMVFSIIIDNGSCADIASTLLVHSLGLETLKHPHPYVLNWFNDGNAVKVSKQAVVSFNIGDYHDKHLCDIAPMHSSHLLLGRPWKYDRKTIHDGYRNTYKLTHEGRKFLIPPLSPSQVYEDQLKLDKAYATFEMSVSLQKKEERHLSGEKKVKGGGRCQKQP